MTDISHSMRMRGAIVAAAGIFIGALCQASLINSCAMPPCVAGFQDGRRRDEASIIKPEY